MNIFPYTTYVSIHAIINYVKHIYFCTYVNKLMLITLCTFFFCQP